MYRSPRQASTKGASKKTSHWLACLFVLVGFLLPSATFADKKLDAEMAVFYEYVFGEKFVKEKVTKRAKKLSNKRKVKINKPHRVQAAKKKQRPPVVVQAAKVTVLNKSRAKNKARAHPPTFTSSNSSQKTDTAALFAKAFGKPMPKRMRQAENEEGEDEEPEDNSKATDINALFAKAFGKKAAVAGPSKVSVDLRINQTVLGDVTVFSNKKGYLDRVGTELFLELLNELVKTEVFERVKKQVSKKEKIRFKALRKLGIKAAYNSVDLSLDLTIADALRKPLVLSMQSKRAASVRAENKIAASKTSGYLNMYSNMNFNSGVDKPELNMKFEGSFSVGKAVFESALAVRNGHTSSDNTRITYDRPRKLQRFTLGNISTGNRNFQENLRLDGLRISKEFFMDPELQIRPKANESFVLDTDSEVEVFINNQLRQRFYLRAGIYSLEDIGLYDGANNIRVRIKDEFGKITEKRSNQYYDSHLLKKGLSLYAFNVGYLNNKQVGAANKLIKNPVLSGYYQKGLTKDLTMSLDAQISSNSYLLGTEMITSVPLGIIKSSFAVSGGDDKSSGVATRFEFRPNRKAEKMGLDTLGIQPLNKQLLSNWTVSGEYRSRDFSLLNSSDSVDVVSGKNLKRLKARLQTNFSLDLGRDWRGSLNLGLSDYYDSREALSANLTATKRFNNGVNLSLGARYDSDDDFSMNIQVSIPLFKERGKRKKRLDLLANSKNNSLESKLSISPTSLVGKNSWNGHIEYVQDDESKQQNVDMSYRNINFESNFSARNRTSNGTNSQQINVGFNSSIACVGKHCATSYPINDSFALVSGPSNQKGPIAISSGSGKFRYSDGNDTGLPDNYDALIPNKNRKAVVRLDSYRFQNINIDESTLPDGYDIEKTEFEVFPRYHQGYKIKAGGEPATILNGILVNEENKALGYKGGQWVPVNGEGKTIAFFSNKIGRFRIMSIPAGKYKLELFDYSDMQTIHVAVPDLKGKVHDIGNVRIVE